MIDIPCLLDEGTKRDLFNMVADKAKDGMNFVEIGSFLGGSICYLGQKIYARNIVLNMTAIDNWKFDNISTGHLQLTSKDKSYYEQFEDNVKKCGLSVCPIIGDSLDVAKIMKDKSIDFLFIDGCHEYPYVKDELIAWLPKMKENSILGGHDYSSSDGIRQAVSEVLSGFEIKFTEKKDSYYVEIGNGLN